MLESKRGRKSDGEKPFETYFITSYSEMKTLLDSTYILRE